MAKAVLLDGLSRDSAAGGQVPPRPQNTALGLTRSDNAFSLFAEGFFVAPLLRMTALVCDMDLIAVKR